MYKPDKGSPIKSKTILSAALAATLLGTCAPVYVERPDPRPVVVVPALPPEVVIETEPYYFYNGYYYYYNGGVWLYSTKRGGPWTEIPRDRYPAGSSARACGSKQRETRTGGKTPGAATTTNMGTTATGIDL